MSKAARYLVLCWLATLVVSQVSAAESSPLVDAAQQRDSQTVHALLQQSVEVNSAQIDGMTALHWAAYHDDAHLAGLLIEAGADVNAANRYGITPLSIACTNGNSTIVDALLAAGAQVNTALRGGETPLMTAARTGRLAPVQALIARGADVNATEQNGQTALMWAAAEGHAEVVKALIAAGADVRASLESGFAPFFFAVREGRREAALALLQSGIDVNDAMQPRKRADLGPAAGTSPLHLAVENGHFELALALLEAGADPNDQRCGHTALHAITWVRKPNSGDGPDGQPPPIGSGRLSSLQFVRRLVEHGADVNIRIKRGPSGKGQLNRTGATPFLLAADTADVPLMRVLVELGADPLATNVDECTPMMAAAGIGTLAPGEEAGTEEEALEAVQLAVESGGDVNAVDRNGETAMHGAAYKSLPKVVEWLAAHGAKEEIWNRKNQYGWTPLAIATGYRVGNFKPSPDTIAALRRVMSPAAAAAAVQAESDADY